MFGINHSNRCACALLALAALTGACDEAPPLRESIAPRQDPDDEPPPVSVTPFAEVDVNMPMSELAEEDIPGLCEMAWHWLVHPETERHELYTRARCLQAVDETKLDSEEQCEEKLERCEATLPVDRYPFTICGLENVAEAAQCDLPIQAVEECVTDYAARLAVTAKSYGCADLIAMTTPPLKVPESCRDLPPECAAAVGLY